MNSFDIETCLQRIQAILQNHPGDSAEVIAGIMVLYGNDKEAAYRELNSKRMWGGAGSIANQALSDNPGMDDWSWQMEIREFRERMIELGQHLQSRGQAYPDISSWLLAFSNWNQSEI
ncbi:MAG: hypothetical protein EP315_06095 [Gammaproteobacteria bacterium]|nr:MAG: hypothetical protein EP315_06095 [Gammaproteobacteria bacterium]